MTRAELVVDGIVQGVGFRPFIYRIASRLELNGWVRNLGGAGVQIVLEGPKKEIDVFIEKLKQDNPPLSEIEELSIDFSEEKNLESFEIKQSSRSKEGTGVIPPDTAMCEKCLDDMRNKESRFYNYWATSCVDCGPRFTVIKNLPYDRETTSMNEFEMCEECKEEYKDPLDRRYHAQTIACPKCGPRVYLEPNQKTQDPIKEAAERLEQNQIVAIKGTGGTHLACKTESKPVEELRERLGRENQPFAIMSPSIEEVRAFAYLNKKEEEIINSIKKPIVVLTKKPSYSLAKEISPGLHTIGVMLPYSGLHHLLFEHIDEPLIMTSANPPGTPMFIENQKIKSGLRDIADSFLLHNRQIVSRCDDSVIRVQGEKTKFLRRSRGYAPSPVSLKIDSEPILALGGELDNTIALYSQNNCYISQYIGDVNGPETFRYLKKSIDHLLNITGIKQPENIVCDLHPQFKTTKYAEELGGPIRVQHHHAHMASILGEKNLDQKIIGIGMDGVGYGSDGKIWGGEVLVSDRGSSKKIGGLSYQEMPGGDLATKYPPRMLAGILYPMDGLKDLLENYRFPYGKQEIDNILKQLDESINVFQTSSTGRFLDAVSALLDVCQKRTYEGEPAMKLEKVARKGEPLDIDLKYHKKDEKKFLDTRDLIIKLLELSEKEKEQDIAATAQQKISEGLSEIAIEAAEQNQIKKVGVSGGVANNSMIVEEIEKKLGENGLELLINNKLPLGDGGISFGQIVTAGARLVNFN
ncbi:carbamoyltransferase HypF [archaeon SCG-AAA382B04]|nr:carbamoyltransferase HypF [archaeon SCG-AAA382B04]